MDEALRYRAELADQFIDRLRALSSTQWGELVAHHRYDDNYYRLALELAAEATQLLGSERVAQYDDVLRTRAARADEIVQERGGTLAPDVRATAIHLAHGAIHALLVRDRYGFNAGAFGELFRPFRPFVDVSDLERDATRVVTPPGVARQTPPDAPPRTR